MTGNESPQRAVVERLAQCLPYRGSDATQSVLALLDSMADAYRSRLVSVAPDDLQRTQGAVQQVIALRSALTRSDASVVDPMI